MSPFCFPLVIARRENLWFSGINSEEVFQADFVRSESRSSLNGGGDRNQTGLHALARRSLSQKRPRDWLRLRDSNLHLAA